jgi:hypothetical protein
MKKSMRAISAVMLLLCVVVSFSLAQTMEAYEATEFNIQFDVPGKWKTTTGVENDIPYLESVSPDESMYLLV